MPMPNKLIMFYRKSQIQIGEFRNKLELYLSWSSLFKANTYHEEKEVNNYKTKYFVTLKKYRLFSTYC